MLRNELKYKRRWSKWEQRECVRLPWAVSNGFLVQIQLQKLYLLYRRTSDFCWRHWFWILDSLKQIVLSFQENISLSLRIQFLIAWCRLPARSFLNLIAILTGLQILLAGFAYEQKRQIMQNVQMICILLDCWPLIHIFIAGHFPRMICLRRKMGDLSELVFYIINLI